MVTQHAPGAVVDVAASHVEQQLLADDCAALVIQVGGVQFDIALPGLQAALGVVELLRGGEGELAGVGAQYAACVAAEGAGRNVQIGAGLGETLVVVKGVGHGEVERAAVGLDQALEAVVEVAGSDGRGLGHQHAVLVVQAAGVDGQVVGDDLPTAVVQVGAGEHQAAAGHFDTALAVVQGGAVERGGLAFAEADQAAEVDDGRRVDRQALLAKQASAGALVGEFGAADLDGLRLDDRALVGQRLRGGNRQCAAGQQVAAGGDGLRVHHQIAGGVAAVISGDAGFDDAGVVHAGRVDLDALAGGDALAVDQGLGAGDLHVAVGVDLVGEVDVLRGDFDVTGGRRLRHAQAPVGVELNIAATGGQGAVELHAHTCLGAHQFDRAGIHAAQGRRVDRQLRLGAAVIGAGGGFQALRIDVVAPGDHVEFAGVDLCVDLGRAGDDVETFDVAGVQAFAVDGHGAAIHFIALQLAACVEYRFAGGEGDVGGVDKAATAARHAVRVGDDDLGRLPRHFGIAAQLAGAAAVDFVEDDVRRAALEVGVADNDPAQLGVDHGAVAVVEDHAVGADVVVLELVMGQARAIGGSDVYHRHAIARRAHGGARRTDHNALGLGQQRLPEQCVGKDQRQPALGQAEERVPALQGGRRLAGQEGELANIHCQALMQRGVELQEKIHAEVDRRFALGHHTGSF